YHPYTRQRTSCVAVAAILLLVLSAQSTAQVVVSGLTPTQESNVRALLPLASASCETGQWRVKRLFRD
ncbi:MAG TPA: hypothetical protein DIT58_01385, partial [Porticoccaceae bacterium]|nr:hypothetical protein [Porticoccaceae bacterium]